MKKAFIGYYKPSDDEFRGLWNEARIVVDANVLLTAYGVSPSTCEALLSLLESVKHRLWMPHQFALEYQRNRLGKILEQIKHYEEAHRHLKEILEDQLRSRTRHPFVSEEVETGLEGICNKLLEGKSVQEKLLISDPHFVRTTEMFEGKIGSPYNESDLRQAHETARKRYSEKIPPGFKDSDKPEPARYADYVGWRQILDFAVKNSVSVILITDDAKEDWWRKDGTHSFGPHPELIAEFRSCCPGLFYMYSSDRFLELSEKYIGRRADPKAVSELKEHRESEPVTESIKSTGAEPSTAKSTGDIKDRGSIEQETVFDTPKLTSPNVAKPEAK